MFLVWGTHREHSWVTPGSIFQIIQLISVLLVYIIDVFCVFRGAFICLGAIPKGAQELLLITQDQLRGLPGVMEI